MRLAFKNIGKISEADIEINSISVIAGNNDTGKSTVGKLLYAVSMALHLITPHTLLLDKFKAVKDDLTEFSNRANIKDMNVGDRIDKLAQKHHELLIDPRQNLHVRVKVSSAALAEFERLLDLEVDKTVEELKNILADDQLTTNKQRLELLSSNWAQPATSVRCSKIQDMILTEFSGQLTSELQKDQLAEVIFEKEQEHVKLNFINNELQADSLVDLNDTIYKSFYIDNPFALDMNSFIRDKTRPYLNYRHQDLLRIWLYVFERRREFFDNAKQNEAIQEILANVIDGNIKFGMQGFQFDTNLFLEPLAMGNVSTGIKSFAIIKLLIETGGLSNCDFLILDEPEIHLHPKWQLKYAQLLVLLAISYPIRIILTSHSPYFVEAIELYTKLYEIDKGVRFYKTKSAENDMCEIINVTDNLELLYKDMGDPIEILQELEEELNDR